MDLSKRQLRMDLPSVDPRKLKRYETKALGGHAACARYEAYEAGSNAGYMSRWKRGRNPYPPGRRHDEWSRAYEHGFRDRPARQYEV